MRFKLIDEGDVCVLTENTCSSSNAFTIAATKERVVKIITDLLMSPDTRDAEDGAIRAERMRDGIRVHAGVGAFTIPYTHIYPLVTS